MSSSPAAPSIASVSACASTSPSEWPGEPARMVDRDPAEDERHAVRERVRIEAGADAILAHPSGSCRAHAPVEDAHRVAAGRTRERDRALEVFADEHGLVGVGRERDRRRATAGAARVGIELADRLAQPRGRDLERDAGLVDGSASSSCSSSLAAHAVDLGEIRMRKHVEVTAARRADERLDVAAPHLVLRQLGPDAEPGSVSIGVVVDHVHRAEEEVPRVRRRARRRARAARSPSPVDLEPELDRQAAALRLERARRRRCRGRSDSARRSTATCQNSASARSSRRAR